MSAGAQSQGSGSRKRQRAAAAPGRSVVLRASAGAGKTRVLVDRFLRLCVECRLRREDPEGGGDGSRGVSAGGQDWSGVAPVHPRSILAITFTRKAAVEIQARLLKRAADLATADPDRLRAELEDLFGGRDALPPSDQEMRLAADLYETFLENPAGLKVGTIHSFCQLVLSRFAAEAGLDPRFTVLEEPHELIDEALDVLQQEMAADPPAMADAHAAGKDPAAMRKAVRAVFAQQMRLERWMDRLRAEQHQRGYGGLEVTPAGSPQGGLGADAGRADLLTQMLAEWRSILFPEFGNDAEPAEADFLDLLARAMEDFAGPGLDGVLADLGEGAAELVAKDIAGLRVKATEAARGLPRTPGAQDTVQAAREVLMTKAGTPRSLTRMRKDPQVKGRFQELAWRAAAPILEALASYDRLDLYRRNRALLRLGLRALDIYDGLKRRDRVADFQDLEDMARRLMGDRDRALSLLWRLDDSLTHILVDEFQDTNFNQYDILRPLIDEFLGGGSGQAALPTVFFVGDPKQSIYGFRGAEPGLFAGCADRLLDISIGMDEDDPARPAVLTLPTNFRSLGAVVEGVGELFTRPPLAEAMAAACRADLKQDWHRHESPGEVLLIPPYPDTRDDQDATDIAQEESAGADGGSGDLAAAEAAAALVLDLKTRAEVTWDRPDGGDDAVPRPLAWKDFLILFRTRTAAGLYEEAFRRAGIPIVPAGRGMLAACREVQDILALLRWLQWPQDEVALATVLRSPVFRLDERRFQEVLAARSARAGSSSAGLWEILQRQTGNADLAEAVDLLRRWRRRAGYEDCHDLLRRIYREGEVLERYRLCSRGDQAVYNLGRLFDVALGAEAAATPTLQRLAEVIHQAQVHGGQEEGVMPADQGEGRVRFMTIHGAKGLEAPVVLLVDADRASTREDAALRLVPASSSGPLLLSTAKADRRGLPPPPGAPIDDDPVRSAARAAELRDRAEQANLLYVAMTRARDKLCVLGGDRSRGRDDHDSPLRSLLRAASGIAVPGLTVLEEPLRPAVVAQPAPAAANPQTGLAEDATPGIARRRWQPPASGRRLRIVTPSAEHAPPGTPQLQAGEDRPGVQSGQGTAAAAAGRQLGRAAAVEHGILVHALLRAAASGSLPPGEGPAWQEAAAVCADKDLAWIFFPEREGGRGLSEVPVIARRGAGAAGSIQELITGTIDRLILRPGRADIVDFKTNRGAGDPQARQMLEQHYRPQLDLYREAIAMIHPDRTVGCWLLFTQPGLTTQARLVELV